MTSTPFRKARSGCSTVFRSTNRSLETLTNLRTETVRALICSDASAPSTCATQSSRQTNACVSSIRRFAFQLLKKALSNVVPSSERDQFAFLELSVGQTCAHLLHLDVLRVNGAEPSQSHHLRNSARIVPVDTSHSPYDRSRSVWHLTRRDRSSTPDFAQRYRAISICRHSSGR